MRARLLLMVIVAGTGGSIHAKSSARIEDMSWLSGCWSFAGKNGITEEHWLPPAGGAMLGLSRTIREDKMVQFEYLAIREVDGKLSYVATPSRQKETVFPLARHSPAELVFENPGHDFPQRVIYRKRPDGLAVRIEGVVDGNARSADFPFKRCPEDLPLTARPTPATALPTRQAPRESPSSSAARP
jgi:hypothetical protein